MTMTDIAKFSTAEEKGGRKALERSTQAAIEQAAVARNFRAVRLWYLYKRRRRREDGQSILRDASVGRLS